MSAPPAASRDTVGKLNYFATNPPPEVLVELAGMGERRTAYTLGSSSEDPAEFKRVRKLVTNSQDVVIHDATKVHPEGLKAWTLQKNGFMVLEAFPGLKDWTDREQAYETYIPPYVDLVKKMTGGKDAVVLRGGNGYYYRNEKPQTPTESYSRFTHTDSGPDSIPAIRRRLVREGVPPEEANTCDICVYNVWHPVDRPSYQNPLCILDAASVDFDKDHVKYTYASSESAKASYNTDPSKKKRDASTVDPKETLGVGVRYNPAHRWVYIPDMTPDQVYLFVQHDTRGYSPTVYPNNGEGRAICTFHDSFHDPAHEDMPKATHGRRSCEFRFFITYPKQQTIPSKL